MPLHSPPYTFLSVPLTAEPCGGTNGTNLEYKGSYINTYIANTKVLVLNYQAPNNALANQLIQSLYLLRMVAGIEVHKLYANGGMIHCVTQ